MTDTEQIATILKSMTYDTMVGIATTFSEWTEIHEDNVQDDRAVSPSLMASLLSDWAESNLPEDSK